MTLSLLSPRGRDVLVVLHRRTLDNTCSLIVYERIRKPHVSIMMSHTRKRGCVSLFGMRTRISLYHRAAEPVMEWFTKLFGRSGKAKREFPNLTRGKDPLEVWNKTGELGDGAFGKVYKVSYSCFVAIACSLVK